MRTRITFSLFALLLLPSLTFAWGTGHDDVAQLLEEFMPVEVKSFFEADGGRDGGSALPDLQKFCHYPDLPNKTLEQTGEIVGPEDEQILNDFGYSCSDWLHRHPGRAACYVLLTKAFREGNRKNAAFYLAVLSHSMSDQGAVNHTPILQFTSCSHLAGVDYGIRNSCELGLKNENVSRQIHERLSRFQPELLAESFPESVYAVVMDCYRQAEVSAEIEVKIAFGDRETSECVMARIAVEQLESILNMTFSAWHFAQAQKEPVFTPEMLAEIYPREEARRREGRPETQAVYAGLFPAEGEETAKPYVGLVCEPFGSFHVKALSYVGKMLVASTGRTLRDHGFAARGISFWKMETQPLPDPGEMPVLVIFAGSCQVSEKIAQTIRDYTNRGGKLLWVGGRDPKNLTGFGKALVQHVDDEVPTSSKWGIQNEDVWEKMSVRFAPEMKSLGTEPFKLVRNPNFDGFCKPVCLFGIAEVDGVKPLAWLNNGRETFCISALNEQAAWVPEYLLLPFIFSDVTTLNWPELRLDPFAEKVMLETIQKLMDRSRTSP